MSWVQRKMSYDEWNSTNWYACPNCGSVDVDSKKGWKFQCRNCGNKWELTVSCNKTEKEVE